MRVPTILLYGVGSGGWVGGWVGVVGVWDGLLLKGCLGGVGLGRPQNVAFSKKMHEGRDL
jgi:hypothetical protein